MALVLYKFFYLHIFAEHEEKTPYTSVDRGRMDQEHASVNWPIPKVNFRWQRGINISKFTILLIHTCNSEVDGD